MDAIVHRVEDPAEYLGTPRKALRAWARDTHLPVRVEAEVPQLKIILAVAFQEGIKFGVYLTEEIAVLDRKRMRLESIDADRNDSVLVQDQTAMLLAPRNLKALGIGKVDQLAVLVRV